MTRALRPLLAAALAAGALAAVAQGADPVAAPTPLAAPSPAAPAAIPAPVHPTDPKAPELIKRAAEAARRVRDPFKRPDVVQHQETVTNDLERYPIDQFKMTGVLMGPRLRAMVRAPNGKSYFLQENMRIGTRKGTVKRITANMIIVRERVVNLLGEEEDVNVEIPMGSEAKSGQPASGG